MKIVVIDFIIMWIVGVVTFFALWAGLLWVVRRIGDKRRSDEANQDSFGDQVKTKEE